MKLLQEISEKDLKLDRFSKPPKKYQEKSAARAILFKGSKIALLYVSRYNYHKLPGGGIKKGESIEQGLRRECLEETGSEITSLGEIGYILERRDRWSLLQKSYCFIAEVSGKPKKQKLTKKELHHGFKLRWVSLQQAIRLVKKDSLPTYESHFIQQRELSFLQKADELLNHCRC
jgi:8-oxo-dGTP diphosphatase